MHKTPDMQPHTPDQRDPEDRLDEVLRHECRWQAPPELTTNLLGLVQSAALYGLANAQMPRQPRPKRWYTVLVSVLTALAITVSLGVAWQFYGLVSSELGLLAVWQQVQALPVTVMAWVTANVPYTGFMLDALNSVRDQLHWLLIAIVLWLALDGTAPRPAPAQQHVSQ